MARQPIFQQLRFHGTRSPLPRFLRKSTLQYQSISIWFVRLRIFAASLRFAQDALPSPEVREQAIAISLATQGQENGHWAARGALPLSQILGVRRFFYNDGYPVLRDLIRNNNYLYMPATIIISRCPRTMRQSSLLMSRRNSRCWLHVRRDRQYGM